MKQLMIALLVIGALTLSVGAQKKIKPWTEWKEKDAKNVLDNSPWGQTQTETDTSEMFFSPTTQAGSSSSRNARGATNQAIPINFRIRFLSAKPIRQAFKVFIEAQQKTPNKALSDGLQAFVDNTSRFNDWIVVAVDYECQDGRLSGEALQIFNGATAAELKNTTYLEIKGGKRVFLENYQAPGTGAKADGMGAKFIFKRTVDGQPFITPEVGEIHFFAEMTRGSSSTTDPRLKLNMRFKTADMMYDGKLEY